MGKTVILTGAGISAESGLATFRASDGLWENHRIEDVATPEAFARNPVLVQDFYNQRRSKAAEARPNAAHLALAKLETHLGDDLLLVTQNVDALHEAAGSTRVLHMHGSLSGALCATCDHRWPAPLVMQVADPCPNCGSPTTRPDIVWFGEMPMFMDDIMEALSRCDTFVSIGTSGNVYPAAGFVEIARQSGAETLEFNLDPSAMSPVFDRSVRGKAGETIPGWVDSQI